MSEKIERGLVVAGVDGSAPSVAALHWAARYAAATGAAVRAVLACHEPTTAGQRPVGALPADVRQETEARLRQVLHDAVVTACGFYFHWPGLSVRTSIPRPMEARLARGQRLCVHCGNLALGSVLASCG